MFSIGDDVKVQITGTIASIDRGAYLVRVQGLPVRYLVVSEEVLKHD